MKKSIFFLVALVMANFAICATAQGFFDYDYDDFLFNEEEYAQVHHCYTGGRGSSQCSIDAGIDFGAGASVACSVTCTEGYYACCGLTCECVNVTDLEIVP